jgi:hypothetical protein
VIAVEAINTGGRGQGGFTGGEWGNGAYGVATFNPAAKTHYLHVLAGPSGTTLSLPDPGIIIKEATVLKTGAALPFKQADGKIVINVADWSALAADGDVIIKVRGEKQPVC